MSVLSQCELKPFEIRHEMGTAVINGYHFQDWAVHKKYGRPGWTITHLPTGVRIPSRFGKLEPAAKAMIEISRLRNDWSVFNPSANATPQLRDQCLEIVARHGGKWDPKNGGVKLADVSPTLNGYRGSFD